MRIRKLEIYPGKPVLDKFGVGNDDLIIDEVNQIADNSNRIMNRMGELGIDVSRITNESFNVNEHIRDFKIKRLLKLETHEQSRSYKI